MDNLAPVVVFAYNRSDKLKKTIKHLMQNNYAQNSELFIFSDGYKNDEDKNSVIEVRDYLKTITGFKKITIFESEINKGLGASIIEGVTKIINIYKKIIVIEDDLQTTPDFLEFLNNSLKYYENEKNIYSIGAYMPPINLGKLDENGVAFIPRICSWGWATWEDRWRINDWSISDYNTFIKNSKKRKQFSRAGKDMIDMLVNQVEGEATAWAIRCDYNRFKYNDALTVYPCKSKVLNIGIDGKGQNTPKTNKYDIIFDEHGVNSIYLKKFEYEDIEITKEFRNFFKRNLKSVLIIYMRRLKILNILKKVKLK